MNPLLFYLIALVLFVAGALFLRKPSRRKRPRSVKSGTPDGSKSGTKSSAKGGAPNDARWARRSVGHFLWITALIPLGLGILTQIYPNHNAGTDVTDTGSGKTILGTFNSPTNPGAVSPQVAEGNLYLQQAAQLFEQRQYDAALNKATAAIQDIPNNPAPYALRGTIYADKKYWDQAEVDYQTVLQLDNHNVEIRFDLAQIRFEQKRYDDARSGFAVLVQDAGMGDLAAYKVFLCDLFSGRDDLAERELSKFNQDQSNASYYFANAAWNLRHKKLVEARDLLVSAKYIYTPEKFQAYADSLIDLVPPINTPKP